MFVLDEVSMVKSIDLSVLDSFLRALTGRSNGGNSGSITDVVVLTEVLLFPQLLLHLSLALYYFAPFPFSLDESDEKQGV